MRTRMSGGVGGSGAVTLTAPPYPDFVPRACPAPSPAAGGELLFLFSRLQCTKMANSFFRAYYAISTFFRSYVARFEPW